MFEQFRKLPIPEIEPKNLRIAARFAVLAAATLVLASCLPDDAKKEVEVRITNPEPNGIVRHIDMVEGTSKNFPPHHKIWVLITDINDSVYHSQSSGATPNGEYWRVQGVRFGNNAIPQPNEDIEHRISLAVADPRGHKTLEEYMQKRNFTGFRELPEGVYLQPHNIVVRRERPITP